MAAIRTSLLGKVTIIAQGEGSDIVLQLDDAPSVKISITITKDIIDNLNLKPGSPAHAVFFSPWPDRYPNTGQETVTIQRSQDKMWVTIPYGDATAEEIKAKREGCTDPSQGTLTAWSYMYHDIGEFEKAQNSDISNGCAPRTVLQQIETVRHPDGSWSAFRYGPNCEARIRNKKQNFGGKPTSVEEAAWLHGFCEDGDCASEICEGVMIGPGTSCGPFLAGFFYDGNAKPDIYSLAKPPSINHIYRIPVNIYFEKQNGTDVKIQYIGQAKICDIA